MKYFARVGDREWEIEVGTSPDGLAIELGGRTYSVGCSAVEPGSRYSVLVDGRSFDVTVGGDRSQLLLVVDGHVWHAEVEDARERAMRAITGAHPAQGGVVESVMPGIVRKVEVAPGAEVKVGDRLLILEAMKMENEIRAEFGGVVQAVHVGEGQTVDGGRPLVTIRPAS